MKSLDSFLNPKRKENIRFVVSEAFIDSEGNPIEWEMRQLTADEGIELASSATGASYLETMAVLVANALVYPNLKDKQFLDKLSASKGKPILKAVDALKAITTEAELGLIISKYSQHNSLTDNFSKKVDEAKN